MKNFKDLWNWFWKLDTNRIHPKIPPIQIIVLIILAILVLNFVKKIF